MSSLQFTPLKKDQPITKRNILDFLSAGKWSKDPEYALYHKILRERPVEVAKAIQTISQKDYAKISKEFNSHYADATFRVIAPLCKSGELGFDEMMKLLEWAHGIDRERFKKIPECVDALCSEVRKLPTLVKRIKIFTEIARKFWGQWRFKILENLSVVVPAKDYQRSTTWSLAHAIGTGNCHIVDEKAFEHFKRMLRIIKHSWAKYH